MWIISTDDFLLNFDYVAFVSYRSMRNGQYEVYAAITVEIDGITEVHITTTETEEDARSLMLRIAEKLDAIDTDTLTEPQKEIRS